MLMVFSTSERSSDVSNGKLQWTVHKSSNHWNMDWGYQGQWRCVSQQKREQRRLAPGSINSSQMFRQMRLTHIHAGEWASFETLNILIKCEALRRIKAEMKWSSLNISSPPVWRANSLINYENYTGSTVRNEMVLPDINPGITVCFWIPNFISLDTVHRQWAWHTMLLICNH